MLLLLLLPESPREASILRFSAMSAILARSYADMPPSFSLSSPSSLSLPSAVVASAAATAAAAAAVAARLLLVEVVGSTAVVDPALGPEERLRVVAASGATVVVVVAAAAVVVAVASVVAAFVASRTASTNAFALDALVYALSHPCSACEESGVCLCE
jgi:hypothetical protein